MTRSLKMLIYICVLFMAVAVRAAEPDSVCRVAVYRGAGAAESCCRATFDVLTKEDGFEPAYVSPEEIQKGALKDFDVVCFPGGTATGQRKALGVDGWKELRAFMNNGGGYYGVCAGAYLALYSTQREEGRLIRAELQEGEWERGSATLDMELTDEGREVMGDVRGIVRVKYENGPIFHPVEYDALEPYVVLAHFRSEIAENGAPEGVQVNSPAIAVGKYGKGRVVISSPHPELTPELNCLVPKLVKCASGK